MNRRKTILIFCMVFWFIVAIPVFSISNEVNQYMPTGCSPSLYETLFGNVLPPIMMIIMFCLAILFLSDVFNPKKV